MSDNRVTLADERDAHGMRVARFDYTQCENDRENIAYARRTLEGIWEAAGAQDTLAIDRYAHLVGGCRMGTRREESVVDADHRAWGLTNLFVADGSALPTQGAANPALTIMALSSRLADRLAGGAVDAGRRAPPDIRPRACPPADRLRVRAGRAGQASHRWVRRHASTTSR